MSAALGPALGGGDCYCRAYRTSKWGGGKGADREASSSPPVSQHPHPTVTAGPTTTPPCTYSAGGAPRPPSRWRGAASALTPTLRGPTSWGAAGTPPPPFTGTFDPQSPAFGVGGGRGRTDLCPPRRRGLGDAFAAWPEGWEQLPCSNNCPPPAAPIAPHPPQLTPSASRSPRIQQTPTQLRPPSSSCPSPPTPVSNCPL